MTPSYANEPEHLSKSRFLRRDWILLPMLGLLTISLLAAALNAVADRMFPVSQPTMLPCLIVNDPPTGTRAIPNTTCSFKPPEGELVEYKFNSCGHRAGMECGPKPPGTYRIVMIGSSFNFGWLVPREKTFAALLPAELSRRSGRKVELYNESMAAGHPASAVLRLNEVFAAEPDMILWPLTPIDIKYAAPSGLPVVPDSVRKAGFAARTWYRFKVLSNAGPSQNGLASFWNYRKKLFAETSSGMLLEHLLYADRNQYVKSYLSGPDSEEGFLRLNPSPEWRNDVRYFDQYAGAIEDRARAAGVPLVAVLLPTRAQATMIGMGQWPDSFDPYKLDHELRAILVSHGGIYIDILPGIRTFPNPEQYYFPVDGHPDAQGHLMFSRLLAKALTSGAVPALRVPSQPAAWDQSR